MMADISKQLWYGVLFVANLAWTGASVFLYETIVHVVFVRPFTRAWYVIQLVIELSQSIIYHVGMVCQLAQKLAHALIKGTNMWVIMTGRLFTFTGILMGGWMKMLLYYFFNKHIIRDIPYGTEGRNFLDVYLPMKRYKGVKVPVVILVSGGAWIIGYKLWNCLIARGLTYFGYIAVLPDHRNYPQGNIVDMITDIRRAVEWTIQHIDKYSGDNENIIIGGQSAGAHVSLSMLVELYKDAHGSRVEGEDAEASETDMTDSEFRKNEKDDFALESADLLSRIKLYIGISGPYNLTEIIYHLHNRGLDYSMLSKVFDHDMCKYSPSIQLAAIAKVPLKKTYINVNMSEHQTDHSGLNPRPIRSQSVGSLVRDSENNLRSLNTTDFITRMALTHDYDDGDEGAKHDGHVVYADPKIKVIPGVLNASGNRGDNFVNDCLIYTASSLHWFGSIWVNLAKSLASARVPVSAGERLDSSYDISSADPLTPSGSQSRSAVKPSSSSSRLQHFPAIALYHGKFDKSIPFYTTIELSNILRAGGLPAAKIHVSIYNNWGHTDGMLEEMLCGDMTLIVDMYQLLHKYCPIKIIEAVAVPLPAAGEKEELQEEHISCLESEKAKGGDGSEVPRSVDIPGTPPTSYLGSKVGVGAQQGLSSEAAKQMELFVPTEREVGVLGRPYSPMVPKTFGTIAKYVNPF